MKKCYFYFSLFVVLLLLTNLFSVLAVSSVLALEPDIPEDMLQYLAENCAEIEHMEDDLLVQHSDGTATYFGGGYKVYLTLNMNLDILFSSDGKDIMELFDDQPGRLFVTYTKSGEPRSAYVVAYDRNRQSYVFLAVGLNPQHIIDGVHALQKAHRGTRKIIASISGEQLFDITDKRQYMVNQYTGYDGNNTDYYNKVIPISDYIGYLQFYYGAENHLKPDSSGSNSFSSDIFTPMPPLKGEPVYLSDWLPYLLIGIGTIGSLVAVFISFRRRSSSEVEKLTMKRSKKLWQLSK